MTTASDKLLLVTNSPNGSTAGEHLLSIFKGRVNQYQSEIEQKNTAERSVFLSSSARKTEATSDRYLSALTSNKKTDLTT